MVGESINVFTKSVLLKNALTVGLSYVKIRDGTPPLPLTADAHERIPYFKI